MSIRKRGNKFTVKVYDPKTPGNQRWIGTFATEEEARDAERAATAGITPAARARTVGEWSIVWLRDYARSAPRHVAPTPTPRSRSWPTSVTSCWHESTVQPPAASRVSGRPTPLASLARCSATLPETA
jgi:hypothetical protein